MEMKSVPVMVDDRKDIDAFMMTRVAYYYVEAMEPSPDIPLNYSEMGIPVLPLEFSGAIHQPSDTQRYFETPDQIEALFRAVEGYGSFYVDSDNIWVPTKLFNKPPARGHIYRIPFGLFIKMYTLCRNDAVLDADVSRFGYENDPILFSEIETIAFSQWASGILENVIAAYPKNEHLKLKGRK
jgi:hypothetical protein